MLKLNSSVSRMEVVMFRAALKRHCVKRSSALERRRSGFEARL